MLIGFDSSEAAGQCVAAIIGSGIIPVAIEFMDRPAIRVCEAFAKAGYPDVEALLIVEVEGSDTEIKALLEAITELAKPFAPRELRVSQSAEQSAAIWKGRKSAFGAIAPTSIPSSRPAPDTVMGTFGSASLLQASFRITVLMSHWAGPAGPGSGGPRVPALDDGR